MYRDFGVAYCVCQIFWFHLGRGEEVSWSGKNTVHKILNVFSTFQKHLVTRSTLKLL
jgi:hypothetical protein